MDNWTTTPRVARSIRHFFRFSDETKPRYDLVVVGMLSWSALTHSRHPTQDMMKITQISWTVDALDV